MLYRTTIITFVFIGVVSAFAIPSNNNNRIRSFEEEADTASDISIEPKTQSISPAQQRMKSNNLRWFVRGVVGELYYNIFLRQIKRLQRKLSRDSKHLPGEHQRCRQKPKNEIAIVTGATGGIGSHMAHELAIRGYDVVVAARDVTRGTQLVEEIKGRLVEIPACDDITNESAKFLPTISFVEYHADNPQSALDVASSMTNLIKSNAGVDLQITVLINNAGIMGKSKQLTMKVNLLGPALLTLALLPLMNDTSNNLTNNPVIINVGSSAHLRATHVIDDEIILEGNETYIDTLPHVEDKDLATYAQSKLALMQYSTLLRHSCSKTNSSITIYDAHPGLVWTPLLRNHIGDRATNILESTGLAHLIYKTPLEGARAIVASLDHSTKTLTNGQVYFENGLPSGYATNESRDYAAAFKLWEHVIVPELKGVVSVPNNLLSAFDA